MWELQVRATRARGSLTMRNQNIFFSPSIQHSKFTFIIVSYCNFGNSFSKMCSLPLHKNASCVSWRIIKVLYKEKF